MTATSQHLLGAIPRSARILEVCPGGNPVARKADGWNVCSVDMRPREQPGGNPGPAADANYTWRDSLLHEAVPHSLHASFDVLIARHVIECLPDPVAFLDSAEALLKPDGVMILAISDKRYGAGYFQPLTTTGELLAASAEARSKPTARTVFDRRAYAVTDGGLAAWGQHPSRGLSFVSAFDANLERPAAAGEHGEIPIWAFSPANFQLLLLELAHLKKTGWRIASVTDATGPEFHAWLRRGAAGKSAALSESALAARRMTLLKRSLLETRAQIDWLLAGEPEIAAGPLALLQTSSVPAAPPEPPRLTGSDVDWLPVRENAARAFDKEWKSYVPGLPGTGQMPLFDDPCIIEFENRFGSFDQKQVLELGPLEGGHTYMLSQRGAIVTAIEANTRAWMRCLVVKDALDMFGVTFLLGDFAAYLASSPRRVDFVLASGVLHRMADPIGLLHGICSVTDAIGLWTHYFNPDVQQLKSFPEKFDFKPIKVTTPHGRGVELYGERCLQALEWSGFCGDPAANGNWLRRQDIIGILQDEGFDCQPFMDQPNRKHGPAFGVFARRR